MNADIQRDVLDRLASRVTGCAHTVSNTLGTGFLEKVYENALQVEMLHVGIRTSQQATFAVRYRGEIVGTYVPDLIAEDSVIIEIKATARLDPVHRVQCMNYLRTTGLSVALLMNFGLPRLDIQRVVHNF